ncbi:EMC6-like membrane protein [Halorussus amylolyticus]|uniref:EMC6-like membrane protein n=1 Tax=Halorussus amylolyticus TaxID=1126242 RepID=UPI001050737E|nr:hypothetical protein [Halorussus amylolyticus]
MATASEQRASHMRGVTVTAVSTLAGVAAAVASAWFLGTEPQSQLGLAVVGAFVFAQFPVLQVLGIDLADFSTKDHLYVMFMTFSLWFVTWTILLTSNVTF